MACYIHERDFCSGFSYQIIKQFDATNCEIGDNIILSILLDSKNRIWIGTETQGLYLYKKEQNTFLNFKYNIADPYSLSHNSVDCIFDDEVGSIWVGTL